MKKIITLLLVSIIICSSAFSQTKLIDSWYATMKGTIGSRQATIYLHKYGSRVEGYFYYLDEGKIIPFDGNIYPGNELVSSVYHRSEQLEEIFKGNLSTTSFTGKWSMNKKTLPFSFTKAMSGDIAFDFIAIEGKKTFPNAGGEGMDKAEYTAASIWLVSGEHQWLKNEISANFNAANAGEDIQDRIKQAAKEYFETTGSNNQRLSDEVFTETVEVTFQSKSLLSLAYSNFTISTGIDGHYGTAYMNFDLKNQKRINIDNVLDTLLDSDDIKILINKKARSMYKLKPNEPLSKAGFSVDEIPLSDNFYLTNKGIGFSYAAPAIAPEDMGQITIFIPYAELPYLNEFEDLLKE